jgi:hypothetical protein
MMQQPSSGVRWARVARGVTLSLLLAAGAGAVGCAGEYVAVYGPPPPPRAEVFITSPGASFVWIPGYWHWQAGGYAWVGGAWRVPPHRGAIWVGPRYEARGHGWVYVRGHWR